MKKVGFNHNNHSKQIVWILVFILLLNVAGVCQKIEIGWKGIKPLKTDKATVDKLLGKPEINDNGYYNYRTDEAFIQVNYSTMPCAKNQYDRGKYNIPKNTVLDYTVRLEKKELLSAFKIKLEDYDKDTSGDVTNFINYRNYNLGIDLGIYVQEKTEYLTDIQFSPSKKDIEIFKCNEQLKNK